MGIKLVALFIFFVLLTLTGIGVWNLYVGQVRMQESVRGTTMITNENNARDLHELLTEYTAVLGTHLEYLYDDKNIATTKEQLSYNTQKIGDVVTKIGTKEDGEKFVLIFSKQTEEYENYTIAAKEKDEEKMKTAKSELSQNAFDFGKSMNKLSPAISPDRGEELMLQHTTLTLAVVDAHAEKDEGKKMLLLKDANLQANVFADEWAKGVEIQGDL